MGKPEPLHMLQFWERRMVLELAHGCDRDT
jgi:hypothetical protein